MAIGREINGVGIGIAAAGIVLTWAGFNNVSPIQAFKDLAMGKAPTPNRKPAFEPVGFDAGSSGGRNRGTDDFGGPVSSGAIVAAAEQVAQSAPGRAPYCWGGGHSSNPCSAKCFDCSGFVSCVLNRVGALKGAKNTVAFLSWKGAQTVAFKDRQAGDLLVTADHIGIAVDGKRMLNAACTGCGPVKLSPYDSRYTVRRVKGASSSSGGGALPFKPGTVV